MNTQEARKCLLITSSLLSWMCVVSVLEERDCWGYLQFCTGFCFYIAALCSPLPFRLSIHLFDQHNWLEKPEINGLSFRFSLLPLCLFYQQYLKCDLFHHRFVPSQTGFEGQLNWSWPVHYLLISLSGRWQPGCSDLPPVWLAFCLCPCDLQVGQVFLATALERSNVLFPSLLSLGNFWEAIKKKKRERDSKVHVFLQRSFSLTLLSFQERTFAVCKAWVS